MEEFDFNSKDRWKGTMMIMQSQHFTKEMFQKALHQAMERRDNSALSKALLESFHEGLSIQIMQVGPYSEEPRTIEKMMATPCVARHREIYLGDPRRANLEKLRTVLRHPIQKR